MGPLARTGIGVALACGVLVAAVSIGQNSDGNDKKETAKGPYVALGDSYTSGPKIPPQTGNPVGCDRSGRNYPALVAKELGIKAADFRDVSCSGATINNLTTPQSTGNGTNPAQLSALTATTRLVTLGIGGNDIGFSSVITKCVTTGSLFKLADRITDITDKAPCKEKYTSGGTDAVAQKIRATGDRLTRALTEIERRAPEAQVYVVGYPAIVPVTGTHCGRDMPSPPATSRSCARSNSSSTPCSANAHRPPERHTSTPSLRPPATMPAPRQSPAGSSPSGPAARQPSSTPTNAANKAWPPPS